MEFGKEFKDFTNKELSEIIVAFCKCDDCNSCPCDGVLCGFCNFTENPRKEFALEVARRLSK